MISDEGLIFENIQEFDFFNIDHIYNYKYLLDDWNNLTDNSINNSKSESLE